MDVEWLTPAEMSAWRAFIETVFDLTNALERDLADDGTTLGDYQVLVFLSEAPNQAVRMSTLAEMLQLSPSGLTRRLDGLVESGLVERHRCPLDGRANNAVLTDAGEAFLERVAPHHLASVRHRIFDRLSDAQVTALESIFIDLRSGLDAPDEAVAS